MYEQGGTQIAYDLTTAKPDALLKLEEFVRCKECAVSTIAMYTPFPVLFLFSGELERTLMGVLH